MDETVFTIAGRSFLKELIAGFKKEPDTCGNCASCVDGECKNKNAPWFGWWINPKSLTGCNFHERKGTAA